MPRAVRTPGVRALPRRQQAVLLALLVLAVAALLREGLALPDPAPLAALLLLCAFDVELGRRAEGGQLVGQRPHKGLSAWPFAAALLCGPALAGAVVVPVYAYARWRGLRVPLWKWVGSGAISVLAGSAAGAAADLHRTPAGALDVAGAAGAAVLVGAVLASLAVSAAGFAASAWTGEARDEAWLRAVLRSREYYATEAAVLCQGAVLAVLWSAGPALLLLAAPSYAVLQRALLHAPLQARAERDAKTGLLNAGTWTAQAERHVAGAAQGAVLLLDLDHFKAVNDRFGHLAGDAALRAVADAVTAAVRPDDLVGRFGGEELVVLLPAVSEPVARVVAERVRAAVADARVAGEPDLRLTASVGVRWSAGGVEHDLAALLADADTALYAAKRAGRDRVVGAPAGAVPAPRQPGVRV